MRIRVALALFVFLGACSMISMKTVPEDRLMFDGSPTPCWPPGIACPPQMK
jgi:hypothetical protein